MNKKDNKKKLIAMMEDLAEEFDQNINITERKIDRWDRMLLKEYGIDKVAKAADYIIKNRKFNGFPKISDIIEAIEGKKEDIETMALESFIEAKDAITKYGSYENVCFDLVINRTIESLGTWQDFCMKPNDHWKQKEFIKNYCMYYREYQAGELEQKSRYLAGINNNPDKRINYINTKHAVPTHKQIDELVKPVNVLKELGKKIEGKKDIS